VAGRRRSHGLPPIPRTPRGRGATRRPRWPRASHPVPVPQPPWPAGPPRAAPRSAPTARRAPSARMRTPNTTKRSRRSPRPPRWRRPRGSSGGASCGSPVNPSRQCPSRHRRRPSPGAAQPAASRRPDCPPARARPSGPLVAPAGLRRHLPSGPPPHDRRRPPVSPPSAGERDSCAPRTPSPERGPPGGARSRRADR